MMNNKILKLKSVNESAEKRSKKPAFHREEAFRKKLKVSMNLNLPVYSTPFRMISQQVLTISQQPLRGENPDVDFFTPDARPDYFWERRGQGFRRSKTLATEQWLEIHQLRRQFMRMGEREQSSLKALKNLK